MGLEQNIIFGVFPFLLHTPLLEYWKEEEREGGQEGLNFWDGEALCFCYLHCIGGSIVCLFICLPVCLKKHTHNKKTTDILPLKGLK